MRIVTSSDHFKLCSEHNLSTSPTANWTHQSSDLADDPANDFADSIDLTLSNLSIPTFETVSINLVNIRSKDIQSS
jgi:hypothetical protein